MFLLCGGVNPPSCALVQIKADTVIGLSRGGANHDEYAEPEGELPTR